MTVQQILMELAPVKPMTRETLYVHLRAAKIKPLGKARQIPVQYPEDTPKKLAKRLGLKLTVRKARAA